jgi:hypothetical protein
MIAPFASQLRGLFFALRSETKPSLVIRAYGGLPPIIGTRSADQTHYLQPSWSTPMNLKSPRRDPSFNLSPVFNAIEELLDQLSHLVESQPYIAIATDRLPVMAPGDPQTSPLFTINEGADFMHITPGAVRHKIFQAEASALLSDPKADTGFLECIVRPPGTRRVFLHRERLMKLIDSWSTSSDMSSKPFNPTQL